MYNTIFTAVSSAIARLRGIRNNLPASDRRGDQLDQAIASLEADLQAVGDQNVQAALSTLQNDNVVRFLTSKADILNNATQRINTIADALSTASAVVSVAGDIAGAALAL